MNRRDLFKRFGGAVGALVAGGSIIAKTPDGPRSVETCRDTDGRRFMVCHPDGKIVDGDLLEWVPGTFAVRKASGRSESFAGVASGTFGSSVLVQVSGKATIGYARL